MLDTSHKILIIISIFLINMIPMIKKKYLTVITNGIFNKIILLFIGFLILFENFILGLIFLIAIILLVINNQENFRCKLEFNDDLEP